MKRQKLAPAFHTRLLASARAFHELIFKTLTSSLIISILQYGAVRSRSLVLLFLLALAYSALAVYALCFVRLVLFASFERADAANNLRNAVLWVAAGLVTGCVVALPSIFSAVVGVLVRRGSFL